MGADGSRRDFLKKTAIIGCGGIVSPFLTMCSSPRKFDLILHGGSVLDGTGADPFHADIGILGDRIAAIGSLENAQAPRVIELRGMHVAPGFIDVHAHTSLLRNPRAESKIFQGVTLDITGPDGGSAFPRLAAQESADSAPSHHITDKGECTNYKHWVDRHSANSMAMNLGSYVGHGTVRALVMGSRAAEPDQKELSVMQDFVRQAMEEGALGLSSGLEYNPAGFAKTAEVIALAKVAAEFGRVYSTHMRSEDQFLVEAVGEAIQISRESGAPLLISHLKVAGRPNWRKIDAVIEQIEKARAEGVNVHCDRYPYLAYSTGLSFFYPGWSKAGGRFREFLQNRSARARMKKETLAKVEANGGWETVMISGGVREQDQSLLGKRIDEIARQRSVDPYELACDLLLTADRISIVGFAMNEENTERIISLPYCMISSDGGARPAAPGPGGHPRSFGTFPRAIRQYVLEKKVVSIQEMIRKMTSLPADTIGLKDRGRLKENAAADIVVFNPETLSDKATYLEPKQYSKGIAYLIVNGRLVIEEGAQNDAMPGRVISFSSPR